MHTLDPLTAAQITAGSTLNRPSAVIRELIENAIDAQAQHIAIYIDSNGTLTVQDDGIGMTVDELPRAFLRHTTSKLTHYDDLLTLRTLGFRGEALAAIGAIARVRCISKTNHCPTAHEIRIAGGELHDLRPCAGTTGTRIIVERLYHTIPHRRQFWRQPHTERQHIVDVCTHYAIIYAHISITVYLDQQVLLHTTGSGNIMNAIHHVWPNISLTPVTATLPHQFGQLAGYIGDTHAGARRQQVVAINNRPIAIRGFIAHLIDEVLPPYKHQHPTAVFCFTLPADSIDVNLRSNKDELGIRTPSTIARLLYDAVRTQPDTSALHIVPIQNIPQLTFVGYYADWMVWHSVEGLVVMNPANVMHTCNITTLAPGALCVPPYVLDQKSSTLFLEHASAWDQLGLQLAHNHQNQLCLTRLPYMAHTNALSHALAACCRTVRSGGSFAMGIGHLLDPHWLYAQLIQHPRPWDGHALFMVGHQRITQALRIPHTLTAAPD